MTIVALVQQHCETTVKLSIHPAGLPMEELEAQIAEALQQAGKEFLQQACKQMEEQIMEADPGLRRNSTPSLAP